MKNIVLSAFLALFYISTLAAQSMDVDTEGKESPRVRSRYPGEDRSAYWPPQEKKEQMRPIEPWEDRPIIRWKDDNGRWHVEPNPFHDSWELIKPSWDNRVTSSTSSKFAEYRARMAARRASALVARRDLNREKVYIYKYPYGGNIPYRPFPNYYYIIPQPPIPIFPRYYWLY